MACNDSHTDELAGLVDAYYQEETYLESELARGITPARIYVAGNVHKSGVIIDSDDYDPQEDDMNTPPWAAVERWAVDGLDMVHVSKTVSIPATVATDFVSNRRRWFRDVSHERAEDIALRALSSDGMNIVELIAPPVIHDTTIQTLRDMAFGRLEYNARTQESQPVREIFSTTRTGLHPRKGDKLPLGYFTGDEDMVHLLAFATIPLADEVLLSSEDRERRLAGAERYLHHRNGMDLSLAVAGLQRAANIVRNGRLVLPSAPQHALVTWS